MCTTGGRDLTVAIGHEDGDPGAYLLVPSVLDVCSSPCCAGLNRIGSSSVEAAGDLICWAQAVVREKYC
jgi:hypothetical protein